MDPNDFIEMKDFKESLKPELDRSFGAPSAREEGEAKPMVFDANKAREMAGGDPAKMEKMAEEVVKHIEL
jgi:hypothetical protein